MLWFKKSSRYEIAFIQPGDEIFGISDIWPEYPPSVRLKKSINNALVLIKKQQLVKEADKCGKLDSYVYSGELKMYTHK